MSLHTTMLESICEIQRAAISRDNVRAVKRTYSIIVATNVPCSFQQPSATRKAIYAQQNINVTCQVFFDSDPGAEADDRLVITEPSTGSVTYVNVVGRAEPVARNRLWAVDGELLRVPT